MSWPKSCIYLRSLFGSASRSAARGNALGRPATGLESVACMRVFLVRNLAGLATKTSARVTRWLYRHFAAFLPTVRRPRSCPRLVLFCRVRITLVDCLVVKRTERNEDNRGLASRRKCTPNKITPAVGRTGHGRESSVYRPGGISLVAAQQMNPQRLQIRTANGRRSFCLLKRHEASYGQLVWRAGPNEERQYDPRSSQINATPFFTPSTGTASILVEYRAGSIPRGEPYTGHCSPRWQPKIFSAPKLLRVLPLLLTR